MEKEEPREGKRIVACWYKFVMVATFRDLKPAIPIADVECKRTSHCLIDLSHLQKPMPSVITTKMKVHNPSVSQTY